MLFACILLPESRLEATGPYAEERCLSCGTAHDLDTVQVARDDYAPLCGSCRAVRAHDASLNRLWRRFRSSQMRNQQRRVRAYKAAVDEWIWSIEGDVPQPVLSR